MLVWSRRLLVGDLGLGLAADALSGQMPTCPQVGEGLNHLPGTTNRTLVERKGLQDSDFRPLSNHKDRNGSADILE